MATLAEVYDYYEAAVYDRERLAGGILALLRREGAETVLDCACGTGLPALDLRARGVAVDCADGSPDMVSQLRQNALERGVDGSCRVLRWDQLPKVCPGAYSYVMCRGNSLVYASSWEDGGQVAGLDEIARNVRAIVAAVAPGGTLHVDVPLHVDLAEAEYPPVSYRGRTVSVAERVESNGLERRWEQTVTIDGEDHRFARRSAIVRPDDLERLLEQSGITNVRRIDLEGERPNYAVLVGKKVA